MSPVKGNSRSYPLRGSARPIRITLDPTSRVSRLIEKGTYSLDLDSDGQWARLARSLSRRSDC